MGQQSTETIRSVVKETKVNFNDDGIAIAVSKIPGIFSKETILNYNSIVSITAEKRFSLIKMLQMIGIMIAGVFFIIAAIADDTNKFVLLIGIIMLISATFCADIYNCDIHISYMSGVGVNDFVISAKEISEAEALASKINERCVKYCETNRGREV